ncbi:Chitinase-3-like protein 2, partial [Morella rubra]
PVASKESTHFTHLFCAFADLDPDTYQSYYLLETIYSFSSQLSPKPCRKNSNVKTLLSIGGPASDPSTFAQWPTRRSNRAAFISSSIQLARTNNFHGLDLFWHPTTQQESRDLGAVLNEWRNAINDEADDTGNEKLLLTAQVWNFPRGGAYQYPVNITCLRLDWINVIAYGLYSPSTSPHQTRAHAAWLNRGNDPSAEAGINAWIAEARNNKIKIVLGHPFFGYAWMLANENNHQINAPAIGASPDFGADGFVGYNRIASFTAQRTATAVFDPVTQTNYCYEKKTWISYDDKAAITNKIQKARGKSELLGYFASHVDTDNNWILSKTGSMIAYIH